MCVEFYLHSPTYIHSVVLRHRYNFLCCDLAELLITGTKCNL